MRRTLCFFHILLDISSGVDGQSWDDLVMSQELWGHEMTCTHWTYA